jgi:hypothetical protein
VLLGQGSLFLFSRFFAGSRFPFLAAVFMYSKPGVVRCCMLHEMFSLGYRLAELGALFSVSSLPRRFWLNEFF